MAKGFFNSQEFKGLNLSDEEFIKVAYRTLLNREADEKGLADWTKALAEGVTRDKVLEGFYKSPEFAALCASYGIAP